MIFVIKEKIRADLSFGTFQEVHEGTFTKEMDYLKMRAVIIHVINYCPYLTIELRQ